MLHICMEVAALTTHVQMHAKHLMSIYVKSTFNLTLTQTYTLTQTLTLNLNLIPHKNNQNGYLYVNGWLASSPICF